jgi:hypothetical protein
MIDILQTRTPHDAGLYRERPHPSLRERWD